MRLCDLISASTIDLIAIRDGYLEQIDFAKKNYNVPDDDFIQHYVNLLEEEVSQINIELSKRNDI